MTSENAFRNSKRKADDFVKVPAGLGYACSSDDNQMRKKNRYLGRKESVSFLAFHLKILRSLYNHDSLEQDHVETNDPTGVATSTEKKNYSDGPVSHQVWEMIECFLQQRQKLNTIKHEAQTWRSIAVEHDDDHMRNGNNKKVVAIESQSSLLSSPLKKRLFTSPMSFHQTRSSPATSSSTKGFHIMAATAKLNQSHNKSHAVVSTLFDRRARVAEGEARRVVRPFHDLYTAVCQRADRLKALVVEASSTATTDEKHCVSKASVQNERQRNTRAELEVKTRLWDMLANDLYYAIQI